MILEKTFQGFAVFITVKGCERMTEEEFETFLSAEKEMLSSFCRSLCQNEHDAQDLFQETVLKFWKRKAQLKSVDGLHTYLFRICVNTYRNMIRSKKRRPEVYEEEREEYLENIPDKSNREEYVLLYDAVSRLKTNSRIVLTLTYFKDLSEKEVAEILNLPLGTIKTRLLTAKRELKKELTT